MCTAKQYRATATQYKERADKATAPDEKQEFQRAKLQHLLEVVVRQSR